MNLDPKHLLELATKGAGGAVKISAGDLVGGAVDLIDVVLAAIPEEDLQPFLDAAAVRRQNAIADAIEDVRFGDEPG